MSISAEQARTPHYRKTSSGEWVVCGPTSLVKAGTTVTVTKRDGTTKTEQIARVGKPFEIAGVQCCYGYIASDRGAPRYRGPRKIIKSKKRCWATGGYCYSYGGAYCVECDEPFGYVPPHMESKAEVKERLKLMGPARWD
jgi:hypothetical protein